MSYKEVLGGKESTAAAEHTVQWQQIAISWTFVVRKMGSSL